MNIDLNDLVEMISGMAQDLTTLKLPDIDLYQEWQGLKNRDLWLEDAICWHTVSRMYKYIASLDPADQTPVKLNIMSPGGDLVAMFALYDLIKKSPVPIDTFNAGGAHSAAFIIFLAGRNRSMTPYATFVAHEGSGQVGGSFRETKAAMKQYEIDVDRMCRIVEAETSLEYEYIKKRFSEDQDWYINYDEAVKTGIVRAA